MLDQDSIFHIQVYTFGETAYNGHELSKELMLCVYSSRKPLVIFTNFNLAGVLLCVSAKLTSSP